MKIDKLLIKVLLILYILYFSQDILYAQGSILSQLALFGILSICGYYLVKTFLFKKRQNNFYKVWTFFLFLNIIGFTLTASVFNESQFGMLKGVLLTLLSFYPFYYWSLKNLEIERYFIIFFVVMIPLAIAQFYTNKFEIIAERITGNTNVVNNSAYLFVSLIPFLFFFKKKLISLLALLVILFFIVQSAKRGALFAGGLGAIIYLFYLLKSQASKSRLKKLKSYALAVIAVAMTVYFAYKEIMENEFLQNRLISMMEGESSNRTENYTWIWEAWYGSDSFFNLIFGFGFAGSLEITGRHFAHNDWLEALSNFGLLGFITYLALFIALFYNLKKRNIVIKERLQLLSIALIWFFMTLVSMFYTSLNSFLLVMVLATIMGNRQYNSITT